MHALGAMGKHTAANLKRMQADEFVAASVGDHIKTLIPLGNDTDYRHHCSTLLRDRGHALHEDSSFIAALDGFLKSVAC